MAGHATKDHSYTDQPIFYNVLQFVLQKNQRNVIFEGSTIPVWLMSGWDCGNLQETLQPPRHVPCCICLNMAGNKKCKDVFFNKTTCVYSPWSGTNAWIFKRQTDRHVLMQITQPTWVTEISRTCNNIKFMSTFQHLQLQSCFTLRTIEHFSNSISMFNAYNEIWCVHFSALTKMDIFNHFSIPSLSCPAIHHPFSLMTEVVVPAFVLAIFANSLFEGHLISYQMPYRSIHPATWEGWVLGDFWNNTINSHGHNSFSFPHDYTPANRKNNHSSIPSPVPSHQSSLIAHHRMMTEVVVPAFVYVIFADSVFEGHLMISHQRPNRSKPFSKVIQPVPVTSVLTVSVVAMSFVGNALANWEMCCCCKWWSFAVACKINAPFSYLQQLLQQAHRPCFCICFKVFLPCTRSLDAPLRRITWGVISRAFIPCWKQRSYWASVKDPKSLVFRWAWKINVRIVWWTQAWYRQSTKILPSIPHQFRCLMKFLPSQDKAPLFISLKAFFDRGTDLMVGKGDHLCRLHVNHLLQDQSSCFHDNKISTPARHVLVPRKPLPEQEREVSWRKAVPSSTLSRPSWPTEDIPYHFHGCTKTDSHKPHRPVPKHAARLHRIPAAIGPLVRPVSCDLKWLCDVLWPRCEIGLSERYIAPNLVS